MATETEPRNAGRRIITQADAEAIAAKARPDAPPPTPRRRRVPLNRREVLTIGLALSGAAALATTGLVLAQPDPATDPLLSEITPESVQNVVPGGFAYPRFKEGEFGGQFVLSRKADSYTENEPPELNPTGKFYVVKSDEPAAVAGGEEIAQQGIAAIYQVCTHLGCLIPYQEAENRFICPCHGSTFERNSTYVRGPATRNLDQFAVEVAEDGTITVNTGQRSSGLPV